MHQWQSIMCNLMVNARARSKSWHCSRTRFENLNLRSSNKRLPFLMVRTCPFFLHLVGQLCLVSWRFLKKQNELVCARLVSNSRTGSYDHMFTFLGAQKLYLVLPAIQDQLFSSHIASCCDASTLRCASLCKFCNQIE